MTPGTASFVGYESIFFDAVGSGPSTKIGELLVPANQVWILCVIGNTSSGVRYQLDCGDRFVLHGIDLASEYFGSGRKGLLTANAGETVNVRVLNVPTSGSLQARVFICKFYDVGN